MVKFNVGDKVVCRRVPNVANADGKKGIVTGVNSFSGQNVILAVQFYRAYKHNDKEQTKRIWNVFSSDCVLIQSSEELALEKYKKSGGVTVICADCGKECIPEDTTTIEGRTVCNDCATENYVTCSVCGTFHKKEELDELCGEEQYICHKCLAEKEDNMPICMICGRPIYGPYISDDFEHFVGRNCQYQVTRCEACNKIILDRESRYIDGDTLCRSCAENIPENHINSYNYKPCPDFGVGLGETRSNFGGYGLELEVEPDRHDNPMDEDRYADRRLAEEITEWNSKVYCKHDGSLSSGGFEMVTHPCTLKYHREVFGWEVLTSKATKAGFRSHDAQNCGLHIHASRTLFGDDTREQELTIAKVIILFNKFYDEELLKFSRRKERELSSWARRNTADILEGDSPAQISEKLKDQRRAGRYYSVNLCNEHTVEFRIFKGTLKANTILASIELMDLFIHYAKTHSVKECLETAWAILTTWSSETEYPELVEYLEEKNL